MARVAGKENQLLRDEAVLPDEAVLERCLGKTFAIYAGLLRTIQGDGYGLAPEWRYYKDGKAWLCKVADRKKKTVFWLSVWDGYFKVSMYFTGKHQNDIEALDIDPQLKAEFKKAKGVGKLIPLVIDVARKNQIEDILTLIEYKKSPGPIRPKRS